MTFTRLERPSDVGLKDVEPATDCLYMAYIGSDSTATVVPYYVGSGPWVCDTYYTAKGMVDVVVFISVWWCNVARCYASKHFAYCVWCMCAIIFLMFFTRRQRTFLIKLEKQTRPVR